IDRRYFLATHVPFCNSIICKNFVGVKKPRSFAQTSAGIGEGISPAARDSPSRCASRLRSITAQVQLAALLQLNQHLPRDLLHGFKHADTLEGNRLDHRLVLSLQLVLKLV